MGPALFGEDSFPAVQNLHEAFLILESEISSLHFLAALGERWWHADGAVPSVLSQEAREKEEDEIETGQRRYGVTFEQCRNIIRYFVEGLSIDRMVFLTGLTKAKIVEVLFLTREVMLRDKTLDNRGNAA